MRTDGKDAGLEATGSDFSYHKAHDIVKATVGRRSSNTNSNRKQPTDTNGNRCTTVHSVLLSRRIRADGIYVP